MSNPSCPGCNAPIIDSQVGLGTYGGTHIALVFAQPTAHALMTPQQALELAAGMVQAAMDMILRQAQEDGPPAAPPPGATVQ